MKTGARISIEVADQPVAVVACGPPKHPTAVISVFEQTYRVDSTPRCMLRVEDAVACGEASMTERKLEELVAGLTEVLLRMRQKR